MPSSALARWQGKRAAELDGLEAVQQALRDAGRQRMSTTQQVNHAWAMLLSSHFQGFCRNLLDELNRWRNAIAHQDFDPAALGGRVTVTLGMIRSWRSACDTLAVSFDLVVGRYAVTITNTVPW